ncbi:ABC-2 type transporter-domain-containing protein [Tricladium varicosporioides]|nr:ABC-2 type transporter-domain-containing protein [Hymenoscyphus varicosporioides]
MLMVLGRPGSGCTTLLKTIAGQTHGFFVDACTNLNYQVGVPSKIIHSEFRGDCSYQAESDVHFPHLTVSQTLDIPTKARSFARENQKEEARSRSREFRNAVIAALGLSNTSDVKIGNEATRGISGGERQRTSLAEVLACRTSLQCWDNSTRGLDSGNALNFIYILRSSARWTKASHIVTMYQASQEIFDAFDKVTLLYKGFQIFFGSPRIAKSYFTEMGFSCPERAITSDFLTSLTNPAERIHLVRKGFENLVPQTPEEFSMRWEESENRANLLKDIAEYNKRFPLNQNNLDEYRRKQKFLKDSSLFGKSPYTINFKRQVFLCLNRCFQRLVNDLAPPISGIAGNAIISIILGSIFYNMPEDTSSFFGRGVLVFFTILTNSFTGAFEGVQLWDHRPIVEKHIQFALYHPSAEAVASMLCDLPNKFLLTTFFNIPFYFMANMRRTPSAFFTFYIFAFVSLLTGSMMFRTIGAVSRTLTASIAPGSVFCLMLIIYTGFVLPVPSMHPWIGWIRFFNPIGYAFESLMINEFSGREFACVNLIPQGPSYAQASKSSRTCAIVGAMPGSSVVNGDIYLDLMFNYQKDHLWRNLGVVLAIMVLFCSMYLLATEYISAQRSKGEMLVFRRKHLISRSPPSDQEMEMHTKANRSGMEKSPTVKTLPHLSNTTQAATFVWNSLSYDIHIKGGTKRILEDIEGYVKPGTLTALMGASGAGKTTLLNVLASRATTGVIYGEMHVDSKFEDEGFARKVGYAQQQDIHLSTSTVREALIFSARLRQPRSYTDAEKLEWVDQLIETLDMGYFAQAIIGIPGEGLNVEQRKRVTIGIELAARPELLLFLDEPTSGLDSNTAWSICTLLKKLAREGQAILCTIHQPSGTLFEIFDKLLLLSEGKSIYFGELGLNSRTLIDYFEQHGVRECRAEENPAEWLLEVTEKSKESLTAAWKSSSERESVKKEINSMERILARSTTKSVGVNASEFATSFFYQLWTVTKRNFELDWRSPAYIYSKVALVIGFGIINGFSFYRSENTMTGVQNQVFSIFLIFLLHNNSVQLFMPHFLDSRALYETRERPSRTYSWNVFIISNIIAELPCQTFLAVVQFVAWYYPIGMFRNAFSASQANEQGGLIFLLILSFYLFSSTFSQMLGTVMPDAATGINISSLLISLSLIFCGVLVPPSALPRFWAFVYRANPLTYFVSALVSAGIGGVDVVCAATEVIKINPPDLQNCASYLKEFLGFTEGTLLNPKSNTTCELCPAKHTNTLLKASGIDFDLRWRNCGITFVYTAANILLALGLYWLIRVPRKPSIKKA